MSVGKTMAHEDFCSRCAESHDCKTLYEQVGKSQGPNIARTAIIAFLLPIAVFITALAVSDHVFKQAVAGKNLRFIIGFALAGCASFACILVVKAINVRLTKRPNPDKVEGDTKSKLKAD
jgi:predicted transporter